MQEGWLVMVTGPRLAIDDRLGQTYTSRALELVAWCAGSTGISQLGEVGDLGKLHTMIATGRLRSRVVAYQPGKSTKGKPTQAQNGD